MIMRTTTGRGLRRIAGALALAVLAATGIARAQEDVRVDELQRQVDALRTEIAAMKQEGESAPPADRLAELERQIEVLTEELEAMRIGEAAVVAEESVYGYGPAASKVYRSGPGVSLGGYGEFLYENYDGELDNGADSGRTDELDALRAVFYFGYKFNDKFLFNSEVEVEHGDEIFLEFAYLDYLWRPELGFRAGHLLVPMGLVNELHEPTVFLGSERPVTESVILPSTWHENGAGIFGEVGQVSYRAYLMNGFDASGFSSAGLRGGRQKGSHAKADDFALVGRLDWQPMQGLLVGGSAYRGDSGQDLGVDVTTTIFEGHAQWRFRGLEVSALWAQADLDDVAALNEALGKTGAASIGESLAGGYVAAGYDLGTFLPGSWQLTPYLRWEQLNTQDDVPRGFVAGPASDREILTLGLEVQPIDQIVVKVDWQDQDNEAGTGLDQFNVAIGYIF